MGRVARSERTKASLRAEARGLKRAKQVMAAPAPRPAFRPTFKPVSRRKATKKAPRALPRLSMPTVRQQLRAPRFKALREESQRTELKREANKILLQATAKPLPKRYKYVAAPKPKPMRLSPRRVGTDVPKKYATRPKRSARADSRKLEREANRNFKALFQAAYGKGNTEKGMRARQKLIDSGQLPGQTSAAQAQAYKRLMNARPKREYAGDKWLKGARRDVTKWLRSPGTEKSLGKAVIATAGPAAPALANVLPEKALRRVGRSVVNVGKDAVDIPAQAIPSTYAIAKPAAEALSALSRGDTRKGGAKTKEWAKLLTDPYVQLAKDPIKQTEEHPLATWLMFTGALRAPGRLVSKGLRVSPSQKLRNAGSITRDYKGKKRPPATMRTASGGGARMEVPRYYSKDAFVKAFQVRSDKRKQAKGKTFTMTNNQQKRRATATNSSGEGVSRVNREETRKASKEATGKKPDAGLVLLVQRAISDGMSGDLLGELKKIRKEYAAVKHEDPAKAATRDRNLELLDEAINKYDDKKLRAAAEKYIPLNLRLQQDLVDVGLIDAEQSLRARLSNYARRYMNASHDGHTLVRAGAQDRRSLKAIERDLAKNEQEIQTLQNAGASTKLARANQKRLEAEREHYHAQTLTTDEIQQHLAENHPDMPDAAFITHDPNMGGKNMHYAPASASPIVRSKRRTGTAIVEGTAKLEPEVLQENLIRSQQLRDAVRSWTRHLKEGAYHRASGQRAEFKDWNGAAQEIASLKASGEGDWVAVRKYPIGAKKNQIDTFNELLDETVDASERGFDLALSKRFEDAFDGMDGAPKAKEGPWILMPKAYANEMRAQATSGGFGPKDPVSRTVGNIFRPVVLATSLKWMTGNITEATVRSAFAHAGIRSWVTGRKIAKRLAETDPELAKLYIEEVTGGGRYGMNSRVGVYVSHEDFTEGTRLQKFALALHKLGQKPGVKQVPQAWKAYTNFVMNTVNRSIERQFQTAMAGKRVRETLMDDHLMKLSNKAIDDAVKGIVDRNTMVDLGKAVDRMYGRYSKFNPTERAWVSTYTPFAAWALNATKFVLWTLPADHPVAVSLGASAYVASEEWRKKHGLSYWLENSVPGWLQGSIPGKGGSHLQVSRFTPFGAFGGETSIYGTLTGTLLPQFMTFYEAGKGRKWTGQELEKSGGSKVPTALKESSLAFLGQMVPFFGPVQNVVKANQKNVLQDVRKAQDPFRYIENRSKTGGGFKLDKNGLPKLPGPDSLPGPEAIPLPPPPPK